MSNDSGERKLPTRAGWWWGRLTSEYANPGPWRAVELWSVNDGESGLWCEALTEFASSPDVEWLAPIPGPEVCAALAEYDAARLAIVALSPVGAHPLAKVGGGAAALQRFMEARTGLNIALALAGVAAITAERDGAA